MEDFKFPALQVRQNGETMYVAVLPVEDLFEMVDVHIWDPDLPEENSEEYIQKQGYQRKAMPRHYKKVSSYVRKPNAILPTSILLSARKPLSFTNGGSESHAGELLVKKEDGPLWVIDGQHRLAGIQHAIEEKGKTSLLNFPLTVCILTNVDKFTEVSQFHIVNSTAKGVRTDLADRLMLLMHQMRPDEVKENIQPKDLWRLRSTRITRLMNQQKGSPWYQRIQAPNSPKGDSVVSERSFSTSLKPILHDGAMSNYGDEEIVKWLTAFWTAVAELMPEAFAAPRDYAVQKTPGVYSFHMVIPNVFSLWMAAGQHGKEGIRKILTSNNEISEYFTREDYWRSGSGEGANTIGMGGFTRLANDIREVLPEAEMPALQV